MYDSVRNYCMEIEIRRIKVYLDRWTHLPGSSLDISAHLFPCMDCVWMMIWSSSSDQGALDSIGSK